MGRTAGCQDAGALGRYRMDLQYDGTDFYGWARQPGLRTIEGCLLGAFVKMMGFEPTLRVAGRTDAGVHARRQVVSLDLPASGPRGALDTRRLVGSLNALTPPGLTVASLTPAAPGFDARRDAVGRGYRYLLELGSVGSPFLTRYAWHVGAVLDVEAMEAAGIAPLARHRRALVPASHGADPCRHHGRHRAR